MTRHVITVPCPCCGRFLEIDTRTGKVRAQPGKDSGLDALLQKQKQESDRLTDLFDGARGAERERDSELDDLFKQAKEKSKDDRDKPRSPFDLE
ncbi:MAG: hypothetical protein HZB39_04010 [Planctomycetes bacterium]|nr:hypothetical protein [Planctomycetota bacterium]